jgi:hypothetical protein
MATRAASIRKVKGREASRVATGSRKQRISRLLREVEQRLDLKTTKVTLADYIRLTQLERELEDDEKPREIIVTWKEPAEERCESK